MQLLRWWHGHLVMLEETEWYVQAVENAFALGSGRRVCEVVVTGDESWWEVESVIFLAEEENGDVWGSALGIYVVQKWIVVDLDVLRPSLQTSRVARHDRRYHWLAGEYHAHLLHLLDQKLGSLGRYLEVFSYAWLFSSAPYKKHRLPREVDPHPESRIQSLYYQVGQEFQGA